MGAATARASDSWAAWRLTDGSETHGWCSPQGKPKGLAFAWELDTTWLLEKLVLSTRNMQESSYPGVSAKLVEVLISTADGPWKSVGKFAVGKEERREHSLPAGTSAARVKLVVLDNHGNADLTELAEVELLGQRTAAAPLRKFGGDYQTNYGPIRLTQEGDQVYGCYDDSNGAAYLWGTATGRVVQLSWSQPDRREGTATFAVTRDERRLWGIWFEGGVLRGEWSGPRVPPNQGPKCTPARKGLGEGLKRQGRVVLYGIRFDSGSDVPRPESSPTLQELAAALTAQKDLSVEIAGHTDTVVNGCFVDAERKGSGPCRLAASEPTDGLLWVASSSSADRTADARRESDVDERRKIMNGRFGERLTSSGRRPVTAVL